MSRLVFVRHSQASFLEDDYDKLSALGQQQAHRLANYWLEQGTQFDEIYCGPRHRHLESIQPIQACYRQAGVVWPDVVRFPEFDEHQVDQLIIQHADKLAEVSETIQRLLAEFEMAKDDHQRHRQFQLLFEAAADAWRQGRVEGIETWEAFRRRVNHGIDRILAMSGRGRTVAVFTSVGPISVALQRAMQCSDHVALQTGWRVANASLTEFVFSADRFTLDVFNALPHLTASDRTYR